MAEKPPFFYFILFIYFYFLDSLWIALGLNLMGYSGQWFSNISWQGSLSKGHSITGSNLIKSESFTKLLFEYLFSP